MIEQTVLRTPCMRVSPPILEHGNLADITLIADFQGIDETDATTYELGVTVRRARIVRGADSSFLAPHNAPRRPRSGPFVRR